MIVKGVLGADLHTKHEFEPGSHVRQLLRQQNNVLWLNAMVTGFESQRLVGLQNANGDLKTPKYPNNHYTSNQELFEKSDNSGKQCCLI